MNQMIVVRARFICKRQHRILVSNLIEANTICRNCRSALFYCRAINPVSVYVGNTRPYAESIMNGVPKGIRTPVAAVKGQCPRPLDDGDVEASGAFYMSRAPTKPTLQQLVQYWPCRGSAGALGPCFPSARDRWQPRHSRAANPPSRSKSWARAPETHADNARPHSR